MSEEEDPKDDPGHSGDFYELYFRRNFVQDVTDRINAIRAGRTMRKGEVADAVKHYCNGLEPERKVALLTFLQELSAVLNGDRTEKF